MKISPARTAAFDILLRIETERAYSSVLLPAFEENLSQVDRSLCHQLVLGTLRRQMYFDRVIDMVSGGKKIDVEIRIALRLAIYQLGYLSKIPQHSAVNESVNLVGRARKTSAKGFVNAILRRISRENFELTFVDGIDRLSVETSHPEWLIRKWVGDFGIEAATQIAAANNTIPAAAFRIIGNDEEKTERLIADSRKSANIEGCYLAERGDSELSDLAAETNIYLQDEASQMVAQAVHIPDGGRFLDVCASPGGKTGLVGERAGTSAKLVAGDLHWSRAKFLQDNCRRQRVDFVDVIQHDAEGSLPFDDFSFDVVLVDAPCSGTGTIRRNPEIRYSLGSEDLVELPNKQLSILKNASNVVRVGGSVIYSTCSLERDENEVVCERFLNENDNFEVFTPDVPKKFTLDSQFARTWPHRDGMDGFFIAAFRRK